jgi:MFS family permease
MTSKPYRNYLLTVLLLILAFNYVDRQALGLVMQNIKVDLHLTDTQLGLLSGIAFALFYSVMGIPIARWADVGNRITIIGLTTALWSVAVALCGFASTFLQLLAIRVAVGVGEAGCIPPAHSLIPDYFNRAERPRAVAIYMLGGAFSVAIGYFLAGWLNQIYGWRATFVIVGLPGLALAALARLTLREPRREEAATRNSAAQPPIREVIATLWASRTYRHLLLCFSIVSFFGNGILQWQPAFFIRSYGLTTGELGTWFAILYGLGGMTGGYLGGALASRRAANNEQLQLAGIALSYCVFALLETSVYLTSSLHVALALTGLAAVGAATITAPLFATVQTLVPERMRAVSIAIIYLFANLIGMGLGPLLAGVLSDALRPAFGEESLRYALLALCPGYLWSAWHLWRASRFVMVDLAHSRSGNPGAPKSPLPESRSQ